MTLKTLTFERWHFTFYIWKHYFQTLQTLLTLFLLEHTDLVCWLTLEWMTVEWTWDLLSCLVMTHLSILCKAINILILKFTSHSFLAAILYKYRVCEKVMVNLMSFSCKWILCDSLNQFTKTGKFINSFPKVLFPQKISWFTK